MNSDIFSRNLRRLRLGKNLTQEQLAEVLGVSVQSVSRWECGNSLPDVMLLPEIAKVYGVTVDDLYRADARGYPSFAQRLLAVYEASGKTEDFLAAEQAFARMPAEERTADDLRAWGVLYHYMMMRSAALARQKLELAMQRAEENEAIFASAAQQKIALLCDLGKGHEEAERYDRMLLERPTDYRLWLLSTAAHEFAKEYEQAMDVAIKAIQRFPDKVALYVHAGDICRCLKRYDEAFSYWHKALDLDGSYLDAAYSMGFFYEELGHYEAAHKVWTDLVQELDRKGLVIEREYPAQRADHCMKHIE